MRDRNEDESEVARRPRDVCLEAAAEVRPVAALGITALEPIRLEAAVPVQFAAKRVKRDAGASLEVVQVLGDRLLVEQDGHDGPAGVVSHG